MRRLALTLLLLCFGSALAQVTTNPAITGVFGSAISGTTGAFTGDITVTKTSPALNLTGTAVGTSLITMATNNALRWTVGVPSGGTSFRWSNTSAAQEMDLSQTGDLSVTGGITGTSLGLTSTLGVRALSTLTDGADGTNTSGYKFVSFVSNSLEAGNVIRVAQTAAVVFTTSSDKRLKNVIGSSNLNAAANRIMAYRMRDFEWKSQPGTVFNGPIAQEIYAVNKDPMIVFPGKGKETWSVNMSGFVPDLIMTIQKQQATIDEQRRELTALRERVEQRLTALEGAAIAANEGRYRLVSSR